MPVMRHVFGIQRQIDPRADADFEHALAGLDVHLLERPHAPRLERRTKRQVVDRRKLLVHSRDEVVLDDRDRQLRGAAAGGDQLVVWRGLVV